MKLKAGLMIIVIGLIFNYTVKAVFSQSKNISLADVLSPTPEPTEKPIDPSISPTAEPSLPQSPTPTPTPLISNTQTPTPEPTPSLEPSPTPTPSLDENIISPSKPTPTKEPVLQVAAPVLTPTPTSDSPKDGSSKDSPKSEESSKKDNDKNSNDLQKAKPKEEVLGIQNVVKNVLLPKKDKINNAYSDIINAPLAFLLRFNSPNLYSDERLPKRIFYSLLTASLIFVFVGFSLLNTAFANYLLAKLQYIFIKIRLLKNLMTQFIKIKYLSYLTKVLKV